MSNAADLRARAIARATKLHPAHIILDDNLREELEQAQASLSVLQTHRAKLEKDGDLPPAKPRNLAEASEVTAQADIDHMITAAREVIASLEQEAEKAGCVLVVNFHRLAPAEYQVLVEKAQRTARKLVNADQAKDPEERAGLNLDNEFLRALGDDLIAKGYDGCTTLDGETVDISHDELLTQVLSHGDLATIRQHCITINRAGAVVDFHRASSGQPAAS